MKFVFVINYRCIEVFQNNSLVLNAHLKHTCGDNLLVISAQLPCQTVTLGSACWMKVLAHCLRMKPCKKKPSQHASLWLGGHPRIPLSFLLKCAVTKLVCLTQTGSN